ncbi:MAG: IS1182 family transposase [Acidobacteria bacterium]|nr:IS1182 family transposase [Acidobacteriota bacterium]
MTETVESEGAARTVEANREQMRMAIFDLEQMLPQEHQARAVWAYVERLNLSKFYDAIRSREGKAGRPAVDPRIYLALWIEATLDGVGSSRKVAHLCQYHLAYQWICGGVPINYHSLSDFRNVATDLLKGLLKQSVERLMVAGVVQIKQVSQDGMKVRAAAGASSFRTRSKLEQLARQQVETLAREIEDDGGASDTRDQRERADADQDRNERITRALEQMDEAEARKRSKNGKKKTEARTSTTDPEARVMKMPDGGYRPAFNVHIATDVKTMVVLAVEVNNEGTDLHAMLPLAEQIEADYGVCPDQWLADGGCTSVENIEKMSKRGCKVIAPVRQRTNPNRKPSDPRPGDSEAILEWRSRMETEQAKETYKRRGATSECVNAHFRNQGLLRFLVRGAKKALAVALMHAIASNMRREWALT